jgi:hypothetical protein
MPYKLSEDGKTVLVERSEGTWVVKKRHRSKHKAKAHMQALNINVHDIPAAPPKEKS